MPERNGGMIPRHNLTRIFDGLSDEQIVYVCAPAGYGKTVAVRQWLDTITREKAAVSLDEYDNSPLHFCERFCAALRACQPKNAALAEIVSHPAFGGAPDEFSIRAIAALSGRKHTVFVIDDLHYVREERVLRLLLIFLKRLPKAFQIILISRSDLPAGFSDLWIKGNLTRITIGDLRFSKEEILQLYKKRGGCITPERADDIYRFTGGWAIGINALLLSGGEPSGESLDYLEGFIRSNIWEKWDESTREFMLNTAAARELHPSLCSVLTGVGDSERVLNRLMRGGAFISQSKDGVYHYHHLFHSFLKGMLDERGDGYLFPLLEKEGHWHLSCRDFYSASECFIRCGSHEGIAISLDRLSVTNRNDFVIERLLPIIKTAAFGAAAEEYPYLFSVMAWAAFVEGRAEDMMSYADQFYARFPEIAVKDPGHTHYIFLMYFIDFRVPLRDLGSAAVGLSAIPAKEAEASVTMNMPLIHRGTRDFSELAGKDSETNIEMIKSQIGWLFGEEAELLAESMTAGLLYEQGHLEKAHIHALAANSEIKRHFAPESKFCAMSALVYVLDAMGQSEESEQVLMRVSSMIEQDRAYYLNNNFNALTTRRKLETGDTQTAMDWLAKHDAVPDDGVSLHGIYESFTTCRAYITCGRYDLAVILLKRVLELARQCNRPLDMIEAHILLSISYWKKKRGFQEEAMRHLEDAVTAAYRFGYTQLFENEGAELAGMMRRLQGRSEQRSGGAETPTSFVKMLYLKTLDCKNSGLTSGQAEQSIKYTDKQKTVMKLLCEGKSYREIAEIMGVKLPTIRSHIALIYKKLDVTSETDAVIKIKASGLLEEV